MDSADVVRGAVVRSRHVLRRPEKLGHRQSKTKYAGQSVLMMTLSEDDRYGSLRSVQWRHALQDAYNRVAMLWG